jgi:catechol 2,3-dioxygenase-like lactoylglutathione lyase family enzyme
MLQGFPVYAVLAASDLGRAKAFYQEKVGMAPTKEDPGGLWYECAGGTWLLVTPSQFAGTAQNTQASFQVENIEALMSGLRERGLAFEEYDLPGFKTENGLLEMGGYKAAWFRDSEGNTIEIAQVREE